ncbi:MAG TPA: M66 family metalloprotease, partial [Polyangiales bacterium]
AGATAPLEAGAARDASAPTAGACPNGEPLVANLKVRELALYQAVKIPLYKDGAWISARNATVVQGKKTLVRAFVEPLAGYTPHALRALLTLDNAGAKTVLIADRNIAAASSDEAADSTFDFPVPGALIGPATQVSLAVIEPSCPVQAPANGAAARIPAAGTQGLNATSIGDLHVVLVPVTLGSNTPDVSEAQLTKYKDALRAYYPVADVEVTAHAPITWTGTLRADGSGWSELLNQIGRTRQSDGAAGNAYYFGLINPSATFRDYCRTGCVLGLAPQTTFVSRPNQIGLGVGFVDENSYTTLVHELGHAHGLPHAPCAPRGGSIQGADTKFPYAGGKIGSWGWDSRSSKLMAPVTYADVMSYCDPIWISDYNYEKIATRCKAVNTSARIFYSTEAEAQSWHGVLLLQDGTARWSGISLEAAPGETVPARALDAAGQAAGEVEVAYVELSHSPDRFLYVPDLDPSWVSLELPDRTLRIADILPALP